MINQIHDNSAVENYLNEISLREAEKTKSQKVRNFTKEAPYRVLMVGGIILALAILFYSLGLGISHARSFKVVTINETIETRNGYETVLQEELISEANTDKLINIEEILSEQQQVIPTSLGDDLSQEANIVRNYYIFDDIPFNGNKISYLTIGRKYSSPNSPPDFEYCYVQVVDEDGLSKRVNLVEINSDLRKENPINPKMAANIQVSVAELQEAQSKCTI